MAVNSQAKTGQSIPLQLNRTVRTGLILCLLSGPFSGVSAQAIFDHWGGITAPQARAWQAYSIEAALYSEFRRCGDNANPSDSILNLYRSDLTFKPGKDWECNDRAFNRLLDAPGDAMVTATDTSKHLPPLNVDNLYRVGSLEKTLGYNLLRYDRQVRMPGNDGTFQNVFWHWTTQVGARSDRATEFLQNHFAHKGIKGLFGDPLPDVARDDTYEGVVLQGATELVYFLPQFFLRDGGNLQTQLSPFYTTVGGTIGTEWAGATCGLGVSDLPLELWWHHKEWVSELSLGKLRANAFGGVRVGIERELPWSPVEGEQLSDSWYIIQAGAKLTFQMPRWAGSAPLGISAAWTQHSGLFSRAASKSWGKEGLRTLFGTIVIEVPHFQFVLINDNPNETDGGASFAAAVRVPLRYTE